MSKKKNERPNVSVFKVFKFGIHTVMKVVPALFIIVNILAICQALVQGFSIFATQMVFDSVSGILTKNEPINRAVLLIIGLGLVLILREIITGVYFYIHTQ